MTSTHGGDEGVPDDVLLGALRRLAVLAADGAPAADLARAVADEIIGVLGAESSAVFRFDGDEIVVVGGSAVPGAQTFLRGARFPVEPQMLAADIRERGAPLRRAEYEADPSDAARRIKAIGMAVVIGAPVRLGGRLWGVVYAAARDPGRLPAGTEHHINAFADLCGLAVASAEDRALLESQALEQHAFMDVARLVLEQAPADAVYAMMARRACEVADGAAGAVVSLDDEGMHVAGRWPEGVAAGDPELVLAAEVAERGGLLQQGDPDATAPAGERTILGREVWWSAPILIGPKQRAVLVVAADKGSALPPDAARRVARCAELCGVALANVDARQELVRQLVETERLATVVELVEDFVAIVDLEGRIAYLNAGGRRLVGLASPEEARARTYMDLFTDEGLEHFHAVSAPTTRREGSYIGETTLRHVVTGEAIPVAMDAFTIRHPLTGRPIGTAVVHHDQRESKRTEEELRSRAEEVEQLAAARRFLLVEVLRAEERMRRQIADALHDDALQELYAARLDLDQLALDPEAGPRARAAIDAAMRGLRDAVSDLHPAAATAQNLTERLQSVLEQGGQRAGFGHRLVVGDHTPGDVDELVVSLLREFVHNAAKHAEATFVVVALRDEGDDVILEVSDDGRGMEPGRPAEALRAGHIGLASSRERVEAIGGRFSIDGSRSGVRIRVELPRGPAAARAPQ